MAGAGTRIHIALLRAVNVGGTGKLPMAELKAMASRIGFGNPRTYIASGNLVFESDLTPAEAGQRLEAALADYAGKPVGVIMRTCEEMQAVLDDNPFPDAPGNRCVVLFLDTPPPDDWQASLKNRTDEAVEAGVHPQAPEVVGRDLADLVVVDDAHGGSRSELRTPTTARPTDFFSFTSLELRRARASFTVHTWCLRG